MFSTLRPEVLEAMRGWAGAGWVPMRRLTTPAERRRLRELEAREAAERSDAEE